MSVADFRSSAGPGRHDERGFSQSVQYAVILPLLMLVTLGVIQTGIWIHAHNVALRAATAAADVARGASGNSQEAHDLAIALADAGGLEAVTVAVSRTATQADVTVSGDAPMMLDLGLGRIRESASAPVERVTGP